MTTPQERSLAARAEVLTRSVQTLSTSVAQLAESQARIKKVMRWTLIGLALDLVFTVVAGVLFNSQRLTNDRVAETNQRIEQVQNRTSNEVLCPLYRLFIAFEPRAVDNPAFSPEEREQRRAAYVVIHQGYDTLGCR